MQATQKPTQKGGSSRPVMTQAVVFDSYQAQQAYRRAYPNTSRSLYLLSVVLRAQGSDENAREVEGIVDTAMTELSDRFSNETKRLERLCEDNGIDPSPRFSRPQEVEIEIATPRANRFIGLIRQLDRTVGLISLLWLQGVRNDSQHADECYLWQRNVIRLANRISEIANRALAAANRAKLDAFNREEIAAGRAAPDADVLTPVAAISEEEEHVGHESHEELAPESVPEKKPRTRRVKSEEPEPQGSQEAQDASGAD